MTFHDFTQACPDWQERLEEILIPVYARILVALIEWDSDPRCSKGPLMGEEWIDVRDFLEFDEDSEQVLQLLETYLVRRIMVGSSLPFVKPSYEMILEFMSGK